MHDGDRRRAERLFREVVSLPKEERAAHLDANCGDARLRAEVEKLIEYDSATTGELTAAAAPPGERSESAMRASAPGRGDLSLPAYSPSPSGPSSSFDHGRFVPGTVVAGRYRIVGLLGVGGMGEVYRADDLELGQSVALKFLPERLASDRTSLDRFRNEVRLARQVSHPNVCRVYDIGQVEEHWFLSMEYVDGEDLSLLLRRIGRFSKDRAVEVARQLCLGLDAAHEKGVLHRDLKPANVMVDGRGKVLITDFGLAEFAGSVEGDDVRSGTPQYMAPEQIIGREVTRQSDIYSLGLVLHEVFTGKPVWEADTLAELFQKRKDSTAKTPSSHVEDLDPAVERTIQACLAADPRDRPISALAVAASLPGGDPLAAALAAGETPSPDAVAASGGVGALRPPVAVALLVVFLAGLAISLINPRGRELSDQLVRRPEFLARDVQDMLESLGLRDPDAPRPGIAYGFRVIPGSARQVEFWYRESPEYLCPILGLEHHVGIDNPPFTDPGMVTAVLSTSGDLRELRVIAEAPGRKGPATADSSDRPDWAQVFRFAGLDAAQWSEVEDGGWIPPVYAGERWTWDETGVEEGGGQRRVEAATCGEYLVFFRVGGSSPGDSGESVEGMPEATSALDLYQTMIGTLFIIIVLAATPMARRNLIRGRSDRRGAFLLATFFVGSGMFIRILGGTHVPEAGDELNQFLDAVIVSVGNGVFMWLFYVSLEPYVRQLWPESLITWSRLLRGRLRDASIGRDVLIGGGVFSIWIALGFGRTAIEDWAGLRHDPSPELSVVSLMGGRFLAAEMVATLAKAIGDSVIFLIQLLFLRVLLRRGWLAIIAFALIWSLMWTYGRNPTSWIIAPPVFATLAILLTRYGLLACIASLFSLYIVIRLPMTLDTAIWYWDTSLYAILAVMAPVGYGFWISLGPQPFAGERRNQRLAAGADGARPLAG